MKLELNFVKSDVPLPNDSKTHYILYARRACDASVFVVTEVIPCFYDPVLGRNRFNTCRDNIGRKNKFEFDVAYYALIDDEFGLPLK